MNLNLPQVLILIGILHGLVFTGVVLFHKKYQSKTNAFLAFTVLSLVVSNTQYWLLNVGGISVEKFIRIPIETLSLPFFYLYVTSYLGKRIKSIYKVFLLLPFVVSICFIMIGSHIIYENFSSVFSFLMVLIIFYEILTYEKSFPVLDRNVIKAQTKWLKQLLIIGLFLCLIWAISLNMSFEVIGYNFNIFNILWIGISILIYWIAYVAVFQAHIFKERKVIRKNLPRKNKVKKEVSPELFAKINAFVVDEENYLIPEMSLDFLAKTFNKSGSYISQIINKNIGKSFNDYINVLRVEKSKELLKNPAYYKYTITAIALESGFKSKSSFYNAFKKHAEMTPSEFKSVQNL